MKRMLLAAVAAATALVPVAAFAQEQGQRPGGRPQGGWSRPDAPRGDSARWGGSRPQLRDQERGDRQRPQAQRDWQRPQAPQQAQDRGDWRRPEGQPRAFTGSSRPDVQQPQGRPAPVQLQQRDWRSGSRPDWQNRGDLNRDQNWRDRRSDSPSRADWNSVRNASRGDGDRRWNDGSGWDRGERWRGNRGIWNNSWRNDRRYDWRSFRNYNRGLYRLPRYYPPARWGSGYRRFSIGYRIDRFLFAQQYWISDPYAYRLPDVWGPYRWVRYYDDALLVDVDTGQVVDVIYGIFW
ncbi:RcnB family protein [Sphingomonas sp. HT-1]|uniref:RcnB family protein n=1 Tax=unclassified Sphingomonas TaxID=196159 RepID=UPI00031D8C4F|nr:MULTISPECIES: RcnB family protein [unclassified Sphingomonas]